MQIFKIKFFYLRFIMLITGCLLIGYGISVFKFVNWGVDSYGTMVIALSDIFKASYGNTLLTCNTILFAISVLMCRPCIKMIGIGTLINMSMIGYVIDFLDFLYLRFFPLQLSIYVKFIWSVSAFFIFSIGVALYIKANLGIAPYELMNMSIIKHFNEKFSFHQVRVFQDLLMLAGGFALGSVIGINTFILSFFTGVVVHFFSKICEKHIIKDRW